jgi:hypothetical protein
MRSMIKTYPKFIYKFANYASFLAVIVFIAGCAFFQEDSAPMARQSSNYLKAEGLVLNREFEKAIPFLDATLKQYDNDYIAALLFSARVYDQIGQPEKAILAATEILNKNDLPFDTELKSRSLLLKNLAKVGTNIVGHPQKKIILQDIGVFRKVGQIDSVSILENLKWALDFSCDQFCVAEIQYLKEIQLEYLYIIETDPSAANFSAATIKNRYEFFQQFLTKEHLGQDFRKKIAIALLDSLRTLSSLQLTTADAGSVRAAKFVNSLSKIDQSTERWLLQ